MDRIALHKVTDLHVTGMGPLCAASGIVTVDDHVYVVADDQLQLGCFGAALDAPGRALTLVDDAPLPTDAVERKRAKPDFESLALVPPAVSGLDGPALLTLGSGSSERRARGVLLPLAGDKQVFDLAPLYATLSEMIPDLNVEGVALGPDVVRLVHRGNARLGRNAVIDLDARGFFAAIREGRAVPPQVLRSVRTVDLGSVQSVPLTFTDLAPDPRGGYFFTVSAEKTDRPYDDGLVLASGLGRMNAEGEVQEMRLFDQPIKIEGVDASLNPDGTCDVRLVSDVDDPNCPAQLFRATL
jgi:hypothetical protein